MTPRYTKAGQRAADRKQAQGKLRTKAGQGRISMAMGSSDPRTYRNAQNAQATERQFHKDFFEVDKQGRLKPRS